MEIEIILGWIAGVTLVAAMIPHQVRTIRLLCLVSGLCAFATILLSGGLWPALLTVGAFVVINAVRLAELRHRSSGGAMSQDERELFEHVMRIEDPKRQSRLRDLMAWRDAAPGERLIKQGQRNPPLLYVASGRAAIERDGRLVSECGAGEFLGEMSHLSGDRASAAVTVTQDMRLAELDRDALAQLSRDVPELGRAIDAAFNRSLAVKVLRMNDASGSPGV
ncbi:MAG: cyclic nucleotide-binding domain-containing protein [Erythrobacter sp.]